MRNTRQAVETAIATTIAQLKDLRAHHKGDGEAQLLEHAIRALSDRHQRLTGLPELPMRVSEAAEIQDFIKAVNHRVDGQNRAAFQTATQNALMPLVALLQQRAYAATGKMQFPEERELSLSAFRAAS